MMFVSEGDRNSDWEMTQTLIYDYHKTIVASIRCDLNKRVIL
jgi:hypothetical protein